MTATKIKLPNDIKNYILFRVVMRLFAFFSGIAVVFFCLWYYKDFLTEYSISAKVFVHVVPFVLVCILTGIPKKLFGDKSWVGTIEEIKVKTVLHSRSSKGFKVNAHILYENIVVFVIRTENGKVINYESTGYETGYIKGNTSSEINAYIDNYKIGDKVVHIYKTKYMQTIKRADDEDKQKNIYCIICGEENLMENEECEKCGYTLHITEVRDEDQNST